MNDEISSAMYGAVMGALSGGVVAYISERAHDVRRRRAALVDQFADNSYELLSCVESYWSHSGLDSSLQAGIIAGINKMRAKLVQLGFDLERNTEVRVLLKEIYQFSTGGLFASKNRSFDGKRAKNVVDRIGKLTSIVNGQLN